MTRGFSWSKMAQMLGVMVVALAGLATAGPLDERLRQDGMLREMSVMLRDGDYDRALYLVKNKGLDAGLSARNYYGDLYCHSLLWEATLAKGPGAVDLVKAILDANGNSFPLQGRDARKNCAPIPSLDLGAILQRKDSAEAMAVLLLDRGVPVPDPTPWYVMALRLGQQQAAARLLSRGVTLEQALAAVGRNEELLRKLAPDFGAEGEQALGSFLAAKAQEQAEADRRARAEAAERQRREAVAQREAQEERQRRDAERRRQEAEFNAVLASSSVRRMYLAATGYEDQGERSRAKTVYRAVVKRFPQSQEALLASQRLTRLGDVEALESASDRAAEAQRNAAQRVLDGNYQQCMNELQACRSGCSSLSGSARSRCENSCTYCSR